MPRKIDVDALFDAAVTEFAENGYRATTTQGIARRAGVNEVTLFRRYGDKATVINTALTHALARSPFAHVSVTDDVRADLVALVTAYATTAQTYGGAVGTLLVEAARHPELRGAMAAFMPNLRNAAGVIAAHQDRGELAASDPMQMLVKLIAPLMMFGLWMRTGTEMVVPHFEPEAVVDTFLGGHRAAGTT